MSHSRTVPWLATMALLFAASCGAFAQRPPRDAAPNLGGTSWRLVKFQGSDDTTLTPDDKAKYTIEFASDGRLSARIDCNRGGGSWKSPGPGQLELGPLALTRAMCPPGSLHDRIVKQWSLVRSYVVRDGHLFLSLMADGGIYEFEPVAGPPAVSTAEARLERTYWVVTDLAGMAVTADSTRGPYLVLEKGGRVAGSDGCNRFTGTYELTRGAIKFERIVATRMACPDTVRIERAFNDALQNASRWKITGDSLELFDAAGTQLARFQARDKQQRLPGDRHARPRPFARLRRPAVGVCVASVNAADNFFERQG